MKKAKEELAIDAIKYAIIGAGGIRIVFDPAPCDNATAENLAIARARNINCALYAQADFGRLFQVYPERREVSRRAKVEAPVYPEMLTAAERGSAYTSLNFI